MTAMDGFPVRRQDQPRAGIGDLDPVAAGLVEIEEERLLDGVLAESGGRAAVAQALAFFLAFSLRRA
jgi:hypothetical protein